MLREPHDDPEKSRFCTRDEKILDQMSCATRVSETFHPLIDTTASGTDRRCPEMSTTPADFFGDHVGGTGGRVCAHTKTQTGSGDIQRVECRRTSALRKVSSKDRWKVDESSRS